MRLVSANSVINYRSTIDSPIVGLLLLTHTHTHMRTPAGEDYSMITTSLTFSHEIRSHNVLVMTMDDDIVEGEERFQVVLSLPTLGSERVTLTNSTTIVTILDDDSELHVFYQIYQPVM